MDERRPLPGRQRRWSGNGCTGSARRWRTRGRRHRYRRPAAHDGGCFGRSVGDSSGVRVSGGGGVGGGVGRCLSGGHLVNNGRCFRHRPCSRRVRARRSGRQSWRSRWPHIRRGGSATGRAGAAEPTRRAATGRPLGGPVIAPVAGAAASATTTALTTTSVTASAAATATATAAATATVTTPSSCCRVPPATAARGPTTSQPSKQGAPRPA